MELNYSAAFQEGVAEEMKANPQIFILGTDLYDRGGHWAQVKGIGPMFGHERVLDAPISEAAMVAAGVGAAMRGMHPIVDLNFIDFSLGAMDEIVNQAAKIRYMLGASVPLVVRGTSGMAHGGPQHNNSLEALFMHVPGLNLAVPYAPYDVKGLIKSALRMEDPVIFLMHKRLIAEKGEVGGPDVYVPFGQAKVVRPGDGATIATFGACVPRSLAAAELLASEGISVEVIDLRTLAPLDIESVVTSVRKTGRLVVVDEAPIFAGPVAEIAAAVGEEAFAYLDAPIGRVGRARVPIPESPPLLDASVPTPAGIAEAVRATFHAFDQVPA
jgi:acetoin:2,6-dichlorophenolindophenol oxidoreductase subunit beta